MASLQMFEESKHEQMKSWEMALQILKQTIAANHPLIRRLNASFGSDSA